MRRLLVNDVLSTLGERTFWHDLQEWFKMEFVGGEYGTLAKTAEAVLVDTAQATADEHPSLIIRNATWFPPIKTDVPQIALLQDIILDGEVRKMQEAVIESAQRVVFNSQFTATKYPILAGRAEQGRVIPLPVDFSLFYPRNKMGMQQFHGIPSGAVCWVGSQHPVKGYDIFLQIVRSNPDIPFVAVFKDAIPASFPPNMRAFARVSQEELAGIMSACRIGLCTSRIETQHLAGIEMGACGLPMVAPGVGVYWKNPAFPGELIQLEPTIDHFNAAIRNVRGLSFNKEQVRAYWKASFNKDVVKAQWESLVKEVECSGQS